MCRHVLAEHQAENGEKGSEETDAALDSSGACEKGRKGQGGHCGHGQTSAEWPRHQRLEAREPQKQIGGPALAGGKLFHGAASSDCGQQTSILSAQPCQILCVCVQNLLGICQIPERAASLSQPEERECRQLWYLSWEHPKRAHMTAKSVCKAITLQSHVPGLAKVLRHTALCPKRSQQGAVLGRGQRVDHTLRGC